MNDYQNVIEYISDLEFFGIKFGLKNITTALQSLGNPHQRFKSIHIAGTNGKGSVSAMLSAIFFGAGCKVGLYTSPHLVSIRERIRINEEMISEAQFHQLALEVKSCVPPDVPITFFEFVTAVAFLAFAREKVDLAIVETGLGGRWDATNVITPEAAIITNISHDHEIHLGKSLISIAGEKAGIIKPNISVVTGITQPRLLNIVRESCLSCGNPLYVFGQDFRVRKAAANKFAYQGIWRKLNGLESNLRGQHQLSNAALALAAVEIMNPQKLAVSDSLIREGLKKVVWPGRQQLLNGSPPFLLDGAHNIAGVKTLCSSLAKEYSYTRLILIWGGMSDKDHYAMLKQIAPISDIIIFTKPKGRRAADPAMLAHHLSNYRTNNVHLTEELSDAVLKAKAWANDSDLVCIAGSLYLIGEAQEILRS